MTGPVMPRHRKQQGSTLIEVLVAMVLFSLGVLGLLRTLSFAVQNSGQAQYRLVAMNVASQRLAQVWADLPHYDSYAEIATAIPSLPNGTRTVSIDGAVITVTVAWQAAGSDTHNHSSSATLPVTPVAGP